MPQAEVGVGSVRCTSRLFECLGRIEVNRGKVFLGDRQISCVSPDR